MSPTEKFVRAFLEQHPNASREEVYAAGAEQGYKPVSMGRFYNKCRPSPETYTVSLCEPPTVPDALPYDQTVAGMRALKQAIVHLGRENIQPFVELLS